MDFTHQSPAILSICPGIRGIERGLERIFPRLRTVAYVEIEAFIVENLLSAMEAGMVAPAPVWTNLKTFNSNPFRNRIHGIIGGYPCQPFSLAGNRKGTEDPRHLWPYIYQIIRSTRPVFCFFENVSGHLSMGYDQVYKGLRDLGYKVECGIYTAEEVGAPQERKRLFILAILEDTYGDRSWWDNEGGLFRKAFRTGKELVNTGYEPMERGSLERFIDSEGRKIKDGSINEPSCSSKLGNSASEHEWDDRQPPRSLGKPDRGSGNELADTNNVQRRLSEPSERVKSLEIERISSTLADTDNNGSDSTENRQGNSQGNDGDQTRTEQLLKSQGFGSSRHHDRFPAGQGEYQFDWEPPRTFGSTNRLPNTIRKLWRQSRSHFEKVVGKEVWTETDRNIKKAIESSVEYTVDGYGFVEDLHRAIGNSVVEQTAEIAFLDLLRKHFQ